MASHIVDGTLRVPLSPTRGRGGLGEGPVPAVTRHADGVQTGVAWGPVQGKWLSVRGLAGRRCLRPLEAKLAPTLECEGQESRGCVTLAG